MTDPIKRVQHGINMANFIDQVATEHHLIDELVANAVEAAANRVEIIHRRSTISVYNDGPTLTLEEVEKSLLTAFQTGPNKSLETNRGLGFIALYRHTSKATIRTGSLRLSINDWDDIVIHEDNFQDGFVVEATLTPEGRDTYSKSNVQKQISNWIYWEPIDIYFGDTEDQLELIGNKKENHIQFRKHPDYPYANLRYCVQDLGFDSSLVFLYKLTQVQVYRKLPISLNLSDLVQNLQFDKMTLIISHGAYLDSTRRSLTDWGINQVKKLLTLINSQYLEDHLRRIIFQIKSQILDEIRTRLKHLSDAFGESRSWRRQVLTHLDRTMTNHPSIIEVISYLDKLFSLLYFSDLSREYSSLTRYYLDHPEFLDDHLVNPNAEQFHNWCETVLNRPVASFFQSTVVGFVLDRGDISGEITVAKIQNTSVPVVEFDDRLFQSAVIHRLRLFVVLHKDIHYLVKLTTLQTLDQLVQHYGVSSPTSSSPSSLTIETIDNINILRYPGVTADIPVSRDRLGYIFQIWQDAVETVIRVYDPKPEIKLEETTTVLVFTEKTSNMACLVHNYIGISINYIQEISTNERVVLLYIAIHEVAHLYCRPHNFRFYEIVADISKRLMASELLSLYLEDGIVQ